MLHLGGSFTKSGAEERAVRGHEGGGALGCRFKGPECGDAGGHDFVRSCALGTEATRVNQARVQPYCDTIMISSSQLLAIEVTVSYLVTYFHHPRVISKSRE